MGIYKSTGIQISLVMSSIRPWLWKRLMTSLVENDINIEVIFVGDCLPTEDYSFIGDNISYEFIYSRVKPAQCYEIGFRAAQGEIVHWTADEAIYSPHALDIQYNFHKAFKLRRLVTGMSCVENGHKTSDYHYIGDSTTPRMMVYGFIYNNYLKELGGYDHRFITGQAENDICMRVLEKNGTTAICEEARVTNNHEIEGIHSSESLFRKWHAPSRKFLEDCWFLEPNKCSKTRLIPFEPFDSFNLHFISQEPVGEWQWKTI